MQNDDFFSEIVGSDQTVVFDVLNEIHWMRMLDQHILVLIVVQILYIHIFTTKQK